MASTKLSRVLDLVRPHRHPPDAERSPKQTIGDFARSAGERDRVLESLRFFDDSLRSLEKAIPPSQRKQKTGAEE
jgi:hypothetical protein